jgi:hypothetical protein
MDGKSYTQPLKLVMDPRVTASPAELQKQFALEMRLSNALVEADHAIAEITQLYKTNPQADKTQQLSQIQPPPQARPTANAKPSLSSVAGNLGQLMVAVDSVDAAPTITQTTAAEENLRELNDLLQKWQAIKGK